MNKDVGIIGVRPDIRTFLIAYLNLNLRKNVRMSGLTPMMTSMITPMVLFLLGLIPMLHGQINQEERRARAYFDAGDYFHAKNMYEDFLDDSMDSWKREITEYNIATTWLAEGKWEEAILSLESLSDKDVELPLLNQRLSSNLALARTMQLKERFKVLKANENASHEDYNQLYMLFRLVLQDINKANASWCALEAVEGATGCSRPVYLKEMELDVKNHFNRFLDEYLAYRLAHVTMQEGISSLIYAENLLLSQLATLQGSKFSESYMEKYLKDYVEQAKSWKVMWEKIEKLYKNESKNAGFEKKKSMFDNSEQLFFDSLSSVEKGDFTNSIEQLQMSKSSLNELLHQYVNESSLNDVLHQLLITYGLALIRDPLEANMSQILETQTALEEAVKKSAKSSILADYEKAQYYLKLSVKSINEFHSIKARLFAEVARFYLKKILEQLEFTTETTAENILENAIAKEEFLLLLDRLTGQLPEDEQALTDINDLMPELQHSTLNAADLFPKVVLARQKESFNADSLEKDRCQCRPWDEVIPLFSQGYSYAELAYRRLESGNVTPYSTRHLQKSAVDKWKEALLKMRSPSSSTQSQKQQQQDQSQQPRVQKDQLQEKKENAKFNEILRMVQDMENDDGSNPKQLKTTGSNKKEERPW